MGDFLYPGSISGRQYKFTISGDTPTADEQSYMDSAVRAQEKQFASQYEAEYGKSGLPDQGLGIGNFATGVASDAVGTFLESPALGIAAYLPDWAYKPTRDVIKKAAYAITPQPVIGAEDSWGYQLGQGVGSFAPAAVATVLTGGAAAPYVAGLYMASGAGQQAEDATQHGATAAQRMGAGALGAAVGLTDVIPIKILDSLSPSIRNGVTRYLTSVLVEGGTEAAQEAAQQVAQNLIAKGVYDPNRDLGDGVVPSATVGGGVGALTTALLGLVMPGKQRGAPPVPPPAPSAALSPPTLALPPPTPPSTLYGTPEGYVAPSLSDPVLAGRTNTAVTSKQAAASAPAPATQTAPLSTAMPEAVAETSAAAVTAQQAEAQPELVDALRAVQDAGTVTVQAVQKGTGLSYPKAQKLLKQLEVSGAVSAPAPGKGRKQLVSAEAVAAQVPAEPKGIAAVVPGVAPANASASTTPNPAPQPEPAPAPAGVAKVKAAAKEATPAPVEQSTVPEPKTMPGVPEPAQAAPADPMAAAAVKRQRQRAKAVAPEQVVQPQPEPTDVQASGELEPEAARSGPESSAPSGELPVGTPRARKPARGPQVAPAEGLGVDSAHPVVSGVPEGPQPAAVTPVPASDYDPMTGAVPGAMSGTARQRIPPGIPADRPAMPAQAQAAAPQEAVGQAPEQADPMAQQVQAVVDQIAAAQQANVQQQLLQLYISRTPPNVMQFARVVGINDEATWKSLTDITTPVDKQRVLAVLQKSAAAKKKLTPETAAALYFSKTVRPIDALSMIADDISAPYDRYVAEPWTHKGEHEFYAGTGRRAAELAVTWAHANMSPQVQAWLDKKVQEETKRTRNQALWAGLHEGAEDRVEASRFAQSGPTMYRTPRGTANRIARWRVADPLVTISSDLTTALRARLTKGDLYGALQDLSTNVRYNKDIRAIAGAMARVTGATKVVVLNKDLSTDREDYKAVFGAPGGGPRVLGSYAADTNTVILDADHLSVATLLHEVAHAATLYTLTQPNHPYTRQLQTIFDAVRDRLPPGTYGGTNLSEFVAELFGDEQFRRILQGIEIRVRPADGGPPVRMSALNRLIQALANFFRKLTGKPPLPPKTSALDAAFQTASYILQASPGTMSDTQFEYFRSHYGSAPRLMNTAAKAVPAWAPERTKDVVTFLNGNITSEPTKRFALGVLPLNAFADVARKYIPEVDALRNLIRNQRGYADTMVNSVRPVAKDFADFMHKDPTSFDNLLKVMFEGTLSEVSMQKTRDAYKNDAEKVAVYDKLKPLWDGMSEEGRSLYRRMQTMNRFFYDKIKDTLKTQIDAAVSDAATRKSLYNDLMAKLVQTANIDPYFALTRKGDYWLAYTAPDMSAEPAYSEGRMKHPPTQYLQTFKNATARNQYRKKLEAMTGEDGAPLVPEVREYMRPTVADVRARPPTQFLKGTLDALQKHKVSDAVADDIMQLFLTFTPEHSFMKSFHKRKGVRGFLGDQGPLGTIGTPADIVDSLNEKSVGLARQLAQMKYGALIQGQRDMARDRMNRIGERGYGTNEGIMAHTLFNEFDARAEFAQRPHVNRAAQWLRGMTFAWTLGANVSAAVNNFAQIPLIAVPFVAGRYGYAKTVSALNDARRLVMNSGTHYEVDTFGETGMEKRMLSGSLKDADHAFSIGNYFTVDAKGKRVLRDPSSIPEGMRQMVQDLDVLVEVADNNGALVRSQAQDFLVSDTDLLAKINKWSSFFFHHTERFNQQATLVMAYNLELAKLRKEGGQNFVLTDQHKEAAALKALETTELVNGATAAAAAPRLAQNPVGSVIFLFKRFGLGQMHMLARTLAVALKDADPMERRIAQRQLAGIFGTAAIFLGASGVPMFKTLMWLLDQFFTGDDEDDAETHVQKFLGEPGYGGLLNYVTGADIASRVSLNNLIFRDNAVQKDQSFVYDMLDSVGGPTLGLVQNMERAYTLFNQGEIYRGIEAASPTALKNALKAVRYYTEGAKTLRDDKIIEDPSLYNIVEQLIGYTPVQYSKTQQHTATEKRKDKAISDERKRLYRQYYLAKTDGDFAGMQEVLADMYEFNQRHPNQKITPDTLKMSMKGYKRRTEEMYNGVSYTPSYRSDALQNMLEYDPNVSLWGTYDPETAQ